MAGEGQDRGIGLTLESGDGFVVGPALVILGAAKLSWYTEASQLMPALDNIWLVIHVTIAILATGKDRKTLVDLGPADRLKIDLQEDDQIEVKGAPAKISDRRILVAQELRHDGETYTITRGKKQQDASPSDRSGREPGDFRHAEGGDSGRRLGDAPFL